MDFISMIANLMIHGVRVILMYSIELPGHVRTFSLRTLLGQDNSGHGQIHYGHSPDRTDPDTLDPLFQSIFILSYNFSYEYLYYKYDIKLILN